VLAVVAIALVSCGGPDPPTRALWRLDDHAGAPSGRGTPAPLVRGALLPGGYYTTTFDPAVRFVVGDGWRAVGESPEVLALAGPGESEPAINMERLSAARVGEQFIDGDTVGAALDRPLIRASVIDEFRAMPGVEVTDAAPISAFGSLVPAFEVRSTVAGTPADGCPRTAPCPAAPGQGGWIVTPGEVVTVVEVPDADLWVLVGGTLGATDTGPSRRAAEPVLASLRLVGR
jgi:hypothetical protein